MMERTTEEDVSSEMENSDTTTSAEEAQPSSPPQQTDWITTLIEQREAFIQDRFSTTLEDPVTGKRIRS